MSGETHEIEDEISFEEIFKKLWYGKYWIISAGAFGGVLAIAIALLLPNVYQAQTMLSPIANGKQSAVSGLAGQLGGLAGLAGINIDSGGGVDKVTLAIETMKSRVFISDFIKKHNLLVPIIAAKGWDAESNRWLIDKNIFNEQENRWVRAVKPPRKSEPSDWEAYKAFSSVFSISQDKKSQLVTLTVESWSPVYAKEWAEYLVNDVNDYLRKKDIEQAERSIAYLNRELAKTSLAQMQAILYQLVEEQTKTVMLTSVRDGYIFQFIDPPVVPEEKIRPKRLSIALFSSVVAAFLACAFVLIRCSSPL